MKQIIRKFRKDLRLLEQTLTDQLNSDTCCYGVSTAQCHALLAIEILKSPSLKDLAAHMHLDKSTLSRTVDSLAGEDLLSRTTDEIDRRIIRLSLTKKGLSVCNRINRENDARFSAVLSSLGTNAKTFAENFSEFVQAMADWKQYEKTCTKKKKRKEQE